MSFSDSDWDDIAPSPRSAASSARVTVALLVATIAGVAIGAIGATWWWSAHRETVTVRSAPAAPATIAAPAEIVASAPPSSGPAEAVRNAAPAAAPPPARRASSPPPLDAATAARRRELAWSRSYERPRECAEDRRGERLVECANHYIRARREFEATYPPP